MCLYYKNRYIFKKRKENHQNIKHIYFAENTVNSYFYIIIFLAL